MGSHARIHTDTFARIAASYLGKIVLLRIAFVVCLSSCAAGAGGNGSALPAEAGLPETASTPLPVTLQPNSPSAHPSNTASVPVTMKYEFGARASTVQSKAKHHITQSAIFVGYTSTAAPISISLNVTPLGGTTSNYTGSCTAIATGTAGTCTVTFTASPGPTTFSGSLSESGNVISSFSQMTIVAPGSANTISFTSNPVVNSVVLQLASNNVNAGTSSNTPLTVNAEDANGNIIAGTASYVDSNGKPVALLLNVTNSQAGGKGTVTIQGPLRITAPGQAAIYAQYDGNWLNQAAISVTSTSSVLSNFTNAILLITPSLVNSYTIPTVNSKPIGLIVGPDRNFWFTEQSANKIGRMTPSGTFTEWTVPTANANPYDLTIGADGNIWFTELNVNKLASITTTGAITEYTLPGIAPYWITNGPDGNNWITENSGGNMAIVSTTTTGISTLFSLPNTSGPNGITAGSDGNLWVVEHNGNSIGRCTLEGVVTDFSIPTINSGPINITNGPDGNIWFTEYNVGKIGRISTLGSINEFTIPNNSQPYGIVQGPDGRLWFSEVTAGNIGAITISGSISEYPLPDTSYQPRDIVLGPDNNIWFSGKTSNTIYKFVY